MTKSSVRATLRRARQTKRLGILQSNGVDIRNWKEKPDVKRMVVFGIPKGYFGDQPHNRT